MLNKMLITLFLLFFGNICTLANEKIIIWQGMYLKLVNTLNSENSDIKAQIKVDRCVTPPKKLKWNQSNYIQENDSGICTFEKGKFTLTLSNNNKEIAHYTIIIDAEGSSVTQDYINATIPYGIFSHFVEHSGILGDQDHWEITIHKKADHWMADMDKEYPFFKNKALNHVFLPGSHDSGTYQINQNSPLSRDNALPQWIRDLENKFPGQWIASYISAWSKTQTLNFTQQLNDGIRYFDLRLCTGKDNKLYICHGMISTPFSDILKQIKQFFDAPDQQKLHSKEIVILDINHLYDVNNDQAINLIKNKIGDLLIAKTDPTIPLSTLWALHKNVIVIYDATVRSSWIWPERSITSPWPNAQNVTDLKLKLQKELASPRDENKLFVLQTQLTPNTDIVEAGINPYNTNPKSNYEYTDSYRLIIRKWLTQQAALQKKGNIIIEDQTDDLWLLQFVEMLNGKQ